MIEPLILGYLANFTPVAEDLNINMNSDFLINIARHLETNRISENLFKKLISLGINNLE